MGKVTGWAVGVTPADPEGSWESQYEQVSFQEARSVHLVSWVRGHSAGGQETREEALVALH